MRELRAPSSMLTDQQSVSEGTVRRRRQVVRAAGQIGPSVGDLFPASAERLGGEGQLIWYVAGYATP